MAATIRVLRLLDAKTLAANAATLAAVLFGSPKAPLTISRGGGWLSFVDRQKLAGSVLREAVVRSAAEVRLAALRFIAKARETMAADPRVREASIPPLFPSDGELTDAGVVPVGHPTMARVDHWLCRFGIRLRSGDALDEPPAEVLGAGIDFRIGNGGDVVAMTCRWRPVVETRSRPRLPAPDGTRRIVYRFNDQAARQTFLGPFYEVAEGEDVRFVPASDRSLTCKLVQSEGPGPVTLVAVASGGSGQYSYTWGRFLVTSFPPTIELLGGNDRDAASSVLFGADAGDVLLHVRDKSSGAEMQLRRAVYPRAAAEGLRT